MNETKFKSLIDVILALDLYLSSEELPDGLSEYEQEVFKTALRALKHFSQKVDPARVRPMAIQEAARRIYKEQENT